jgi:PilZ domain
MMIMTAELPRTKVQREPRRQMPNQSAWMTIDDGTTRQQCTVLDISPGGAKIVTDGAMDVGNRFGLTLVPDHPRHLQCEVVWRRGKTCGVKFLQ